MLTKNQMNYLIKALLCIAVLFFLSINVLQAQQVKDGEGNAYSTIQIGDKIWMGEDLRIKTAQAIETSPGIYTDPPKLMNAPDAAIWEMLSKREMGAYSSYNNEPLTADGPNGYLYNWYAINCNLCPSGYHIPTAEELKGLIAFQAKEKKNVGDGIRKDNGEFANRGSSQKTYWSKTESTGGNALNGCAFTNNGISWSDGINKGFGLFIRCVSDKK